MLSAGIATVSLAAACASEATEGADTVFEVPIVHKGE